MIKVAKIQNIFDICTENESLIQLQNWIIAQLHIQEILLSSWFTYTNLLLSEKLTQGYFFCCVLQKENYEVKKEKFWKSWMQKRVQLKYVVWKAHRMFEN